MLVLTAVFILLSRILVYPIPFHTLICNNNNNNNNNMAACFNQLPPELLLQIKELVGLRDQLQLSATCRDLRAAAVHQWGVFRSIRFSARRAKTADSVLAVVKSYPGVVQKLKFVIDPAPCSRGHANPTPTYEGPSLLPESALALLRGCSEPGDRQQLAPSLRRLAVKFPDAHAFRRHLGRSDVSIYMTLDDNGAPEFARDNNTMVDQVLGALAHTTHPVGGATRLALLNLPPHRSPVFATHQWRRLLGRVRDLELSVFGEQRTFEMTSNGDADYRAVVAGLADGVFRHLAAVETLRFCGSVHAPLGYKGGAPLPLVAVGMPRLRYLTLGNVCAGDQLLGFLKEHEQASGYLRSLGLAYATADSEGPRWSDFFVRLILMKIQIIGFGVTRRSPYIPEFIDDAESHGGGGPPAAREISVERLMQALSVWPSAGVRGEFGGWVEDRSRNLQSGEDGLDEAAYEEFMDMVDATAGDAASEEWEGFETEEYSDSE
ncbi:hypothetical protein RB594_008943 [Gaeumannomyces avenae]